MEVWGVQVSGLGRGVGDGIWEKLRKRDENLAERSNSVRLLKGYLKGLLKGLL